jgi:hypothetical protein
MQSQAIGFIIGLMLVSHAQAASILCDVIEHGSEKTAVHNLTIDGSADPHGALVKFEGKIFTHVSGFVALVKKESKLFAVLNISSEAQGIHASSHHQILALEQPLQHQILIPDTSAPESEKLTGIEIQCLVAEL